MPIKAGSIIGNIIWLVFGGLLMAIGYFTAGVASILTIIGIPNGVQSFKLGIYACWPFGKKVVERTTASGCIATIGNIIWILLGGIWLAIGHLLWALLFYILIVTIPFARRHVEMTKLAFTPFGKDIVDE
ncbi:MAG: YccF domain-containing protein [Verrucomicrobiales bacterium]|nr:YccF domain-containing protein [Verrucomicrobiales bacterium]